MGGIVGAFVAGCDGVQRERGWVGEGVGCDDFARGAGSLTATVPMPKIRDILLLHHSHTDVGFTHPQPVFWEMQRRFLDAALAAAERDAESREDHAFKWVVETTAPVMHWLERTPGPRVKRFAELCAAGRIEVTAQYLHLTPSADTGELAESLVPLVRLREMGIPVGHAMSGDVNGHNWPMVDALLDAGVGTMSMAINEHFGGAPFVRPNVFRWAGPSGRTMRAFNGPQYHLAHWLGVLESHVKIVEKLPVLQGVLDRAGWPSETVPLQVSAYLRDNGTAGYWLSQWVQSFNAVFGKSHGVRLRLGTWGQWWGENGWTESAPVYGGDWTDYWNFGAGSAAGLGRRLREARSMVRTAGVAQGLLGAFGGTGVDVAGEVVPAGVIPGRHVPELMRTAGEHFVEARRQILVGLEHTFGGSESVGNPEYHEAVSFDHFKDNTAHVAGALARMLVRDAVAELSRYVKREGGTNGGGGGGGDGVLVFNPLPWVRTVWGRVPKRTTEILEWGEFDPAAVRHFQDRARDSDAELYPAVELPALGFAALPSAPERAESVSGEAEVEVGGGTRLVFDLERGGLAEWHDGVTGRQLVQRVDGHGLGSVAVEELDRGAAIPPGQWPRNLINGPIHWTIEGHGRAWHPEWPAVRRGAKRVVSHRVERFGSGVVVRQVLEVEGVAGGKVEVTFTCGRKGDSIRIDAEWTDVREAHPRAAYVVLGLNLPGAEARVDVGGVAMRVDKDQLPGVCRDYYTAQNYVSVANSEVGVTIGCSSNPLVQIGGFEFGKDQREKTGSQSVVLGWVTNNYWETNFRAFQPERVRATYWLKAQAGGFDEVAATRFGMESAVGVVYQTMKEPPHAEMPVGVGETLLKMPEPPMVVVSAEPRWGTSGEVKGVLLRVMNCSDVAGVARFGEGVLGILGAEVCDLLGVGEGELKVEGGWVGLPVEGRRVRGVVLRLRA